MSALSLPLKRETAVKHYYCQSLRPPSRLQPTPLSPDAAKREDWRLLDIFKD